MSATTHREHRFLQPLDVLFMRGNKLFGDAGSYGDVMVLPWPSAVAGALRSQILAQEGVDFAAFALSELNHPMLGTPNAPGPFALQQFTLARQIANDIIETLHPIPADLVVSQVGSNLQVSSVQPQPVPTGLVSSSQFPLWPVLAESARSKSANGYWLTQSGWQSYLNGELPDTEKGLVQSSQLWAIDHRIGIGMDGSTRSAANGKLFTSEGVVFKPDVGFLVTYFTGMAQTTLNKQSMIRLGGDGRSAISSAVEFSPPVADLEKICSEQQCRFVLTTPGLFQQGWLPNGFTRHNDGCIVFNLHGVRARLVCAMVPRQETVSGWDLAQGQPKQALRAAPTGSVYWLTELEATPQTLGNLANNGLWNEPCDDLSRRAEGFNRFAFAAYADPY